MEYAHSLCALHRDRNTPPGLSIGSDRMMAALGRDPVSGKTSYLFSCFNQDQELDRVDFGVLSERLKQNSLQEKLVAQWIALCLKKMPGAAR